MVRGTVGIFIAVSGLVELRPRRNGWRFAVSVPDELVNHFTWQPHQHLLTNDRSISALAKSIPGIKPA
jgi:hypothetical protein